MTATIEVPELTATRIDTVKCPRCGSNSVSLNEGGHPNEHYRCGVCYITFAIETKGLLYGVELAPRPAAKVLLFYIARDFKTTPDSIARRVKPTDNIDISLVARARADAVRGVNIIIDKAAVIPEGPRLVAEFLHGLGLVRTGDLVAQVLRVQFGDETCTKADLHDPAVVQKFIDRALKIDGWQITEQGELVHDTYPLPTGARLTPQYLAVPGNNPWGLAWFVPKGFDIG